MQDYFKQKNRKNPVFKAKDINLETKTDFGTDNLRNMLKTGSWQYSVEQSVCIV